MYVCMYVTHKHTHSHVCMYACMYARIHVCIHTHSYIPCASCSQTTPSPEIVPTHVSFLVMSSSSPPTTIRRCSPTSVMVLPVCVCVCVCVCGAYPRTRQSGLTYRRCTVSAMKTTCWHPQDAHRAQQDGTAYSRDALALTGPRAAAALPQRP